MANSSFCILMLCYLGSSDWQRAKVNKCGVKRVEDITFQELNAGGYSILHITSGKKKGPQSSCRSFQWHSVSQLCWSQFISVFFVWTAMNNMKNHPLAFTKWNGESNVVRQCKTNVSLRESPACITVELKTVSFEFISYSSLLGCKSVKAAHSTHGPLLAAAKALHPASAAFGFWASFHFQFSPLPFVLRHTFFSKQSNKG